MKANELRIGNWVVINSKYIYVDAKTFHAIIHEFDGYVPEPIGLTPEILEKCGFVREKGKVDIFTKSRLRISFGLEVSLCFLVEEDTTTGHFIPTQISFLHQLQNLYFALTGEELEVNL